MDAYQDAYLDPPWKNHVCAKQAELSKITLACMDTQLLPAVEHRDPKRDSRDCSPLGKPQSRDEHPGSPRACSAPGWHFRMGKKSHKNPPKLATTPGSSTSDLREELVGPSKLVPALPELLQGSDSNTPGATLISPLDKTCETPRITPSVGTEAVTHTHSPLGHPLQHHSFDVLPQNTALALHHTPATSELQAPDQAKQTPSHPHWLSDHAGAKLCFHHVFFPSTTAVVLSNNPMEVPNHITRLE